MRKLITNFSQVFPNLFDLIFQISMPLGIVPLIVLHSSIPTRTLPIQRWLKHHDKRTFKMVENRTQLSIEYFVDISTDESVAPSNTKDPKP